MKTLAWVLAACALGCVPEPKNAAEALEAKCAGDARAEYYVGGASVEFAMRVYDICMARGHGSLPADGGTSDGGTDVPR